MSKSTHRRLHQCSCPICQQHPHGQIAQQHRAINRVLLTLNEKNRRHFGGLLAIEWGPRKITLLAQITGLSRTTIHRGKREVEHPGRTGKPHIRAAGAGRIAVKKNNPAFLRQ